MYQPPQNPQQPYQEHPSRIYETPSQRPPMPPYQPPKPPPERNFIKWFQSLSPAKKLGVIVLALFILYGVIQGVQQSTLGSHQSATPTAQAAQPTAKPQPAQYPPKTEADLHALAAKGNANAIHTFKSESVGLAGVCPQPKREVTVDPGVTGQQLAEDLLAYFYSEQIDSPCGSIVFVYHTQAEESTSDGYTAGRILFNVSDSSGNDNTDPNGTNLKHELTLDIGGFLSQKEYVVTY